MTQTYNRIKCLLMTENRKLLIFSSKMRDYIGKKCEQSLYLNSKLSPENKFKMEAFWFVFKSFCYQIFINFPKKVFGGVGGGGQKKAETRIWVFTSATFIITIIII